ncbi:MAG: hypothetical protein AAGC53_23055 [Actinomycetota bacterium]
MAEPSGFSWTERKDGSIVISHRGRRATVLRGAKAARFAIDVSSTDEQQLMARLTGKYKRGNERSAARRRTC